MLKTVMHEIETALKAAFPKLPMYREYVRQGFQRPCFCLRGDGVELCREVGNRYLVTAKWRILCYDNPYDSRGALCLKEGYHEIALTLYDVLMLDGYMTKKMGHRIVEDTLEFTLEHSFFVTKEEERGALEKMVELTIEME